MNAKLMSRLAAIVTLLPAIALASGGDSGTGAAAEMQISGGQFLMLLGGVGVLGIVIWLLIRFLNR